MSYRSVLTRHTLRWALIATGTRLPIAMAPLSMIFLLQRRPGGYATGSVLAACFILGEVVGAGALGALLDRRQLRRQMLVGLAIGLAGFTVLALSRDASPVLLGVAAFVAGAGPAIAPGILRTVLTNLVDEAEVSRAFSADSVLTEFVWLAAPALVVLLALGVAPQAPFVLCVGAGVVALVGTMLTSKGFTQADDEPGGRAAFRVIMTGLPIYLTSAATMALSAAAELALPALLKYRGLPVGWSALLLTGLAAFSALGAFLYGLRARWPGAVARQSLVLLLATTASIAVAVTVASLAGIIVGYFAAGLFQSAVLITRNLSLRERLPKSAHPAGYSVMYAVQGVGYSLVAVIIAAILSHASPVTAMLSAVAVTVLLTIASSVAERRAEVRSPIADAAQVRP